MLRQSVCERLGCFFGLGPLSLSLAPNVLFGRVKVGSVTPVPKWAQKLLLGSGGQLGAIGLSGKSSLVSPIGPILPFFPRSCQALMVLRAESSLELMQSNSFFFFFSIGKEVEAGGRPELCATHQAEPGQTENAGIHGAGLLVLKWFRMVLEEGQGWLPLGIYTHTSSCRLQPHSYHSCVLFSDLMHTLATAQKTSHPLDHLGPGPKCILTGTRRHLPLGPLARSQKYSSWCHQPQLCCLACCSISGTMSLDNVFWSAAAALGELWLGLGPGAPRMDPLCPLHHLRWQSLWLV